MSGTGKSAWAGYRRWRWVAWTTSPVTIYLIVSGGNTLLIFPLFVISAMALVYIRFFECPECGKSFFHISGFTLTYSNSQVKTGDHPFSQKCVYCGFPKWAEPSPRQMIARTYPNSNADSQCPDPVFVENLRLAEYLTLVLRDDPGAIGLRLDAEDWTDVDHLLARSKRHGIKLSLQTLSGLLLDTENSGFQWDQKGNRIRHCR